MRRKWLVAAWTAAVGAGLVLAFVYGIAVAYYEVFPFSLLKFVQKSNARFRGDSAEGKKLFGSLCSQCHGVDGSGAEGPSLIRPRLSRAADDEALRRIIVDGIENGRMPPVRQTTTKEQNDLIAYVRALGRTTPTEAKGNARRGREVYDRLGCSSCHIMNGDGTAVGPELTRIAQNRGQDYLRQALIDPASALPSGTTDVSRGFDEFLPVRLVTRGGREIRGMRVNEDTFTIQIRDTENQFHSFEKLDLLELEQSPRESLMPSLKGRITEPEIDDLVAYLSDPAGAQ